MCCNDLACCCWHSPCITSACPGSCYHTECCLQTNRVLVDLFEHIVSWVLPDFAAASLALLSLLLPSLQLSSLGPAECVVDTVSMAGPGPGKPQTSGGALRSTRAPVVYSLIDK